LSQSLAGEYSFPTLTLQRRPKQFIKYGQVILKYRCQIYVPVVKVE